MRAAVWSLRIIDKTPPATQFRSPRCAQRNGRSEFRVWGDGQGATSWTSSSSATLSEINTLSATTGALKSMPKSLREIVPVALRGTFDIMPKNRLLIRPRPVTLSIGEPVAVAGYGLHTKEALMDEVRGALQRQLAAT